MIDTRLIPLILMPNGHKERKLIFLFQCVRQRRKRLHFGGRAAPRNDQLGREVD